MSHPDLCQAQQMTAQAGSVTPIDPAEPAAVPVPTCVDEESARPGPVAASDGVPDGMDDPDPAVPGTAATPVPCGDCGI